MFRALALFITSSVCLVLLHSPVLLCEVVRVRIYNVCLFLCVHISMGVTTVYLHFITYMFSG